MKTVNIFKEVPEYYQNYIQLITTDNLLFELEESKNSSIKIFSTINRELENFSYQPNKWTVKEVLRHLIDSERIFAYRALRFSRFDKTELAGYNENIYIENLKPMDLIFEDLVKEYLLVRDSTIQLFKGMTNEMLNFKGQANNVVFTPELLGFIIAGHNIHHCNILTSRYINI